MRGTTLCLGLVLAGAAAAFAVAPAPAVPQQPRAEPGRPILLGRSHQGRPIRAIRLRGDGPRVLVVGCIHGDECAGIAVVRRLLRAGARPGVDLWLVPNLNPDGFAAGRRQNARGVDLNRNFPSRWRPVGAPWHPEYAGPRPASERETRIAMSLIQRIRPQVTVWYHQHRGGREFVRAWGGSVPAGRRYARLAGVSFRRLPWPNGSAPNWQNHRFPSSASFVVEFPRGPLAAGAAARHAAAVSRPATPRGAGSGGPR